MPLLCRLHTTMRPLLGYKSEMQTRREPQEVEKLEHVQPLLCDLTISPSHTIKPGTLDLAEANERLAAWATEKHTWRTHVEALEAEAIKERNDIAQSIKLTSFRNQYADNPLSDEDCSKIMRQLFRDLDKWIVKHLVEPEEQDIKTLDPERVLKVGGEGEDEVARHLFERANFHNAVSKYVCNQIFAPLMFGLQDACLERLFGEMSVKIKEQCPPVHWHHWLTATNIALRTHNQFSQKATFTRLTALIRRTLFWACHTDMGKMTAEIDAFLHRCADFKKLLERQEHTYYFEWSERWTAGFQPCSMHSLTEHRDEDSVVSFTLWPSLWRETGREGEREIVERAIVWSINDKGKHVCFGDE